MSSMSTIASTSLLALALTMSACESSDEPAVNENELAERLATPTTLDIVSPSYALFVAETQGGGEIDHEPLQVESGRLVLHADERGALVLDALTVDLSDMTVDDGVFANQPRVLTDLRVALTEATVVEQPWSDNGRAARLNVHGTISLDWSLVDEATGDPMPLPTQTWREVEINAYVFLQRDGSVAATLASTLPGRVFDFWGIEISEWMMNVTATDAGR